MIESINKNTEVVGVSDALKQLATRKSPSINNSPNPPLMKQNQIDDDVGSIMDNKITINPSSSNEESTMRSDCENGRAVGDETTQTCGWWMFRPVINRENFIECIIIQNYSPICTIEVAEAIHESTLRFSVSVSGGSNSR